MYRWFKLKLDIARLKVEKHTLEISCTRLAAQWEERDRLFKEWSAMHTEHKEIISALLDAIRGKVKQ